MSTRKSFNVGETVYVDHESVVEEAIIKAVFTDDKSATVVSKTYPDPGKTVKQDTLRPLTKRVAKQSDTQTRARSNAALTNPVSSATEIQIPQQILDSIVQLEAVLSNPTAEATSIGNLQVDAVAQATARLNAVYAAIVDNQRRYQSRLNRLEGDNVELSETIECRNREIAELKAVETALRAECHQIGNELQTMKHRVGRLEERIQSERELHQDDRLRIAISFWNAKEEFYQGLHRGILAEHGINRQRLTNFRRQALIADIGYIVAVGAEALLLQEALDLAAVPYDGSIHRWCDERYDPVLNGTQATVYLPGWRLGTTTIKPFLGTVELSYE